MVYCDLKHDFFFLDRQLGRLTYVHCFVGWLDRVYCLLGLVSISNFERDFFFRRSALYNNWILKDLLKLLVVGKTSPRLWRGWSEWTWFIDTAIMLMGVVVGSDLWWLFERVVMGFWEGIKKYIVFYGLLFLEMDHGLCSSPIVLVVDSWESREKTPWLGQMKRIEKNNERMLLLSFETMIEVRWNICR